MTRARTAGRRAPEGEPSRGERGPSPGEREPSRRDGDPSRSERGPDLDGLVSELMSRPLSGFVAARDDAVRRLRGEGRRQLAGSVAGLRRPSAALWAANRLADTDPRSLNSLLDAGDGLRRAQASALAGEAGAGPAMARAASRLGAAVGDATAAALRALGTAGHGGGGDAGRRLESMLRAAAVAGEEVRGALREGRLVEEPRPEGFDLLGAGATGGAVGAAAPSLTAAPSDPRTADGAATEPEEHRRERAAGEREEQRRRQAALETALRESETAVRRAEVEERRRSSRVAALEEEMSRLEERLTGLRERLAAERSAAEAADRALDAARRAAGLARGALLPRSTRSGVRAPEF